MQCYLVFSDFTLGPNISLVTLLLNTLSLCSSPNVRDQVSHLCKATDKLIVLCTLMSLDSKQEAEDAGPIGGRHCMILTCFCYNSAVV